MSIVEATRVHANPRPPGNMSISKMRWHNLREKSTHSFGPSVVLCHRGESLSVPYDPDDDPLAISTGVQVEA